MSEVIAAARVVTSSGVHSPGWIEVSDGAIVAVGSGRPETVADDLGDVTVVPGFVDLHVHGGGGEAYTDGPAAALAARDAHLAHGTTTTMASLVSAPPEALLEQVRRLAPLVAAGELRGIHLEGPWLAPSRKGAHDPAALRDPSMEEIDALLEAADGAIGMVTIAPELPGSAAAIARFVEAGAVVAIGHTDADFDTTARAIDAGATVATHLFNAMPPLLHREPGPVLALLRDPRVTVELIDDGVHLHPELVEWVIERVGPERVMLVTDAMGAAACGDGDYRLGSLDVAVRDGIARVAGTGTIAGSTATMGAMFRRRAELLPGGGANADALVTLVRIMATTPARAAGWHDVGDIAPGLRADLVVLDRELRVQRVMRAQR